MPFKGLAQNSAYTLNGKVAQLQRVAKVYLAYNTGTADQIDSAIVTDGSFSFTGVIEEPVRAYLVLTREAIVTHNLKDNYIDFYLEAGTIRLDGTDSLKNAKFSGGRVNEDYQRLKIALTAVRKDTRTGNDSDKKDAFARVKKNISVGFIKNNPNSIISLYTLQKLGGQIPDVEEVEPLFNSLSAMVRNSKPGVEYAERLSKVKATAIGAAALNFTLPDAFGKMVSLHEFKGKYVLIDFWASWCGPCRAENPNLVKAYRKYKNRNFTILGISLDDSNAKDEWFKAVKKDHLTWTQVSDLQGWNTIAARLYAIEAIPQNFLIAPDGKIVAKNVRGQELEDILAKLLK